MVYVTVYGTSVNVAQGVMGTVSARAPEYEDLTARGRENPPGVVGASSVDTTGAGTSSGSGHRVTLLVIPDWSPDEEPAAAVRRCRDGSRPVCVRARVHGRRREHRALVKLSTPPKAGPARPSGNYCQPSFTLAGAVFQLFGMKTTMYAPRSKSS